MRAKDIVMSGFVGVAVGVIGIGYARDTRMKQDRDFYRAQYRQGRTELSPLLGGTKFDDNMGTAAFRALQCAYHRGVRDGERKTLTAMGEGKITVDNMTDHWQDLLKTHTAPDWDLLPPKG